MDEFYIEEYNSTIVKVCVETYGCTMNQGEGRMLEDKLSSMGHEIVDSAEEAELVVVNTCTVIQTTENKNLKRITELRDQGKQMIVSGCMAVVQEQLILEEAPDAVVVPIEDYDSFKAIVDREFGSGSHQRVNAAELVETGEGEHLSFILPIAQGCLGGCAYCITRWSRGRLQSYTLRELLGRSREAVSSGHREILVTAQDTAAYGQDRDTDLGELVSGITSIEGEFRVRVGMMNPFSLRKIMDGYLQAWLDDKVYKFLHLPVQSGSDRLLERMNRRNTVQEFKSQVSRFREAYPELTLSTDVIVGFPGETEEDHRRTVQLIREVRPNILNITRFSSRPHTAAAEMEEQVHGKVAKERSRELTDVRFEIAEEIHHEFVGKTMRVLMLEEGKYDTLVGRTDCYKSVVVDEEVPLGEFIDVKIVDSAPTHLYGEPM